MSDDNNNSDNPLRETAEWIVENPTESIVGYYAGVAVTAVILGPFAALAIGGALAKVGLAALYFGTKK